MVKRYSRNERVVKQHKFSLQTSIPKDLILCVLHFLPLHELLKMLGLNHHWHEFSTIVSRMNVCENTNIDCQKALLLCSSVKNLYYQQTGTSIE